MESSDVALLLVQLDERRIGLPAAVVRRIVRAAAITPLPRAPSIVEGVLNVHGTVLPVLDVRRRFGLPAAALHPDQHFVIADAGERRVVLRVDRALAVTSVPADRLDPAAHAAPYAHDVAGLVALPDGVLVIYDLERFLSLDESAALDAALAAAASGAHPRPRA